MRRRQKRAEAIKLRRASTLSVSLDDGRIIVHNFLSGNRFACSPECLGFLSELKEWRAAEDVFDRFPHSKESDFENDITQLLELRALLVKGTQEAELDEVYRRQWLWGSAAGLFHFSTRNTRFVTGYRAREFIRARKAWRKSPSMSKSNRDMRHVVTLPTTDVGAEPFALMRKRRSRRSFDRSPITQQILADCLFAGNGIVGFIKDKDFGRLPLSMTPSGGARNPFELYVYAARVEGLATGFYHYDATKRSLALVRIGKVEVPKMLGTQKWPAGAAAIVLLAAHFPRTMWKYHMPIAYRVVAMEAGFIGQNIALAATHYGLSAVPSGAINDTLIERYLELPRVESSVLLTMSIGRPTGRVR